MPQPITNSTHHLPIKPYSYFDRILKTFFETGRFILINEIVTTEALHYMRMLLAQHNKPSIELGYEIYLDNLILDIEIPEIYSQNNSREYADDELMYFLADVIEFSPTWKVIALDNVTILKEEIYYPLSFNFMWQFGNLIVQVKYDPVRREKKKELIVTDSLIVTNAEFHSWVWRELLRRGADLDNLTIEFLANGEQDENLTFLCEVLQYSCVDTLNLGNTEFTQQGYQILYQFLKREPFIKVHLREPIDSKSRAILKQYKNRITHPELDESSKTNQPVSPLYINQLIDGGTRTLGHKLLEKAFQEDDVYMVKYLIKAEADLLEQLDEESPFLLKLFKKNRKFKLIILNYIIHQKVLANRIEHDLQNYEGLKKSMADMEASFRAYAKILRQRTHGLLNDCQKLLNLFKTMASLPRPSKNRDQEFIDIYWRLFKSVVLFHGATGRVTIESIANTQAMLTKIINLSEKAELGWSQGSRLHKDLGRKLNFIIKEMNDIKELITTANQQKARLVDSAKVIDAEELKEPNHSLGFCLNC